MDETTTIDVASRELLDRLPNLDADALEALVRHHNEAYWEKNAPEVDDPTFDKLVESLRMARPDSAALWELGERLSSATADRRFQAVHHEQPMLSLDKCYDDETLRKWAEKIQGGFWVTPKIDGLACSIRYDASGKLARCATRGDGKTGDDITENAARIEDIPKQLAIASAGPLEVRGEVYLRLSRFRERFADQFANPRNLAAGALKQKDAQKSAEYGLSFFAYDLLGAAETTERDKAAKLRALGFQLPESSYRERAEELSSIFRAIEARRAELDYETDGVVIKSDLVSEHERLGLTAHHPRYAIAYKFQGEGAQTRLLRVEWSVGRTGVITPVAVTDPVFVSGVTVTRASLHNAGYTQKLGLKVGALVELVRRGGVIPHVERVLSADGEDVVWPAHCPSCGGDVRAEGDFLYCAEPDRCPDVIRGRVSYFCTVIDVLGFGKKHIRSLIDTGWVKTPADLYRLNMDQLCRLERMGPTLAAKLVNELNARRKLPLAVFLSALGIEEVGPTVAETLASHFPSLDKLRSVEESELSLIHGVGPSIAASFVKGMRSLSSEMDSLLQEVEIVLPEAPAASDHPLAGKGVVFTGKLAFMDRKSAQKRVRDVGGKTPAGVSADLHYLVVGDDGSPLLGEGQKSSKQVAGEKLVAKGVPLRIITEKEFLLLLDGAA